MDQPQAIDDARAHTLARPSGRDRLSTGALAGGSGYSYQVEDWKSQAAHEPSDSSERSSTCALSRSRLEDG